MKIFEEIEILKEVVNISPELICGLISEANERHSEGKATSKDKFLLGLRYPEFFAKNDDDHIGAYRRAEVYRNQIGIKFDWLCEHLRDGYGLY